MESLLSSSVEIREAQRPLKFYGRDGKRVVWYIVSATCIVEVYSRTASFFRASNRKVWIEMWSWVRIFFYGYKFMACRGISSRLCSSECVNFSFCARHRHCPLQSLSLKSDALQTVESCVIRGHCERDLIWLPDSTFVVYSQSDGGYVGVFILKRWTRPSLSLWWKEVTIFMCYLHGN